MKQFYVSCLTLLFVGLLLAGCNNRSRGRVRTDSSIPVDSSPGDGSTDGSMGDSSPPSDTSVPIDTSVPPDTSTPGECIVDFEAAGSGLIAMGNTIDETEAQSGSCGGSSAPEAIVSWTPSTSGSWTLDTIGSDYDTVLYVRSGACTGTEEACNDDSSGTQSSVTITATVGLEYFVFVDGYSGTGNWVLNANPAATP